MVFSGYIVGYLFCAGAGAGAFFAAAACCVWDAVRRSDASERAVVAIQPGFYAAPCLLLLACVLLVSDLGVVERAWVVITAPFQSVMSIGAWLVALLTLISTVLAVASLALAEVPRVMQVVCSVVGLALAAGTMAYTGLLLSDLVSVDFWHTPWLVVLFVVSSLSCGIALIIVVDTLSFAHLRSVEGGLWRVSGAFGIVEAVALGILMAVQWGYTDVARASCALLLTGSLALPFWGGVIGAGIALPLVTHLVTRGRPSAAAALAAACSLLAGGLALRYCVVAAALYTPLVAGAL
ncbi:NrfD/PsrC family molybdoenzyme membrane anchor subunit [Adlercreutzia sp. ZJ473]|uniref:NrfD/PsrC family molybdoenzyme membrane anchor subunit n=1 Tax=Adlercreutzia sp. ZJ473 TaxID=2722822 RepID=UPI001552D392|nr:NrfD/PsrC family molybdoenzyme membrane anchor subunit [Adlercreutzia sp. ZJ473]